MKGKYTLVGITLVALMAVGCSSKPAAPTDPAGGTAQAKQEAQPPAPGAAASPAPASTAGTAKYVVVADASSATYSVGEKFLNRNLDATAVGKTTALKGEIVLENGVIKPSVVQVDVSALKSDENRRDNRVREALDTANHKLATFSISGAEGNPVLKEGQEITLKLQGTMTIKGTEKPLVFDAKAKLTGDTLTLTAAATFKMSTFGVNPPNIVNIIPVNDEVKVDVTFVGKR